jgi:hypothetical protein
MEKRYLLNLMSFAFVGLSCNAMEMPKDPDARQNQNYLRWDGFDEDSEGTELGNLDDRITGAMEPIIYDLEQEIGSSDDEYASGFLQKLEGYLQCMRHCLTCGFMKQEEPSMDLARFLGRVKEIKLIGEYEDGVVYLVKSELKQQTPDSSPPITKRKQR